MKRISIHFYIDEEFYKTYEKIQEDFVNSLIDNCKVEQENIAVFEYKEDKND